MTLQTIAKYKPCERKHNKEHFVFDRYPQSLWHNVNVKKRKQINANFNQIIKTAPKLLTHREHS